MARNVCCSYICFVQYSILTAMQQIPLYIFTFFICAIFATLVLLYKAGRPSAAVIVILILWLVIQSVVAYAGFYLNTTVMPPRFLLLVAPPLTVVALLFITPAGKKYTAGVDMAWLNWLHIVRIPVELVLFWLYVYRQIPQVMTFEGRNFDILAGLTAPVIAYLGYQKAILPRMVLICWNIIGLALLLHIVGTAILAVPFPFQQIAFEQPNVAVLYFPFILLPGFIVPAVLFAHLLSLKQLLVKKIPSHLT